MAKPKFTLTTDLVKVEPEPQPMEPILTQHVHKDSKQQKNLHTEKEALNLKVSKKLKKEFQLWCIMKGKTMTEAMEDAMEKLIRE